MDRHAILRLYIWTVGTCFRCARAGVPATVIAVIPTPAGEQYSVMACQACALELEAERERYAKRHGERYVPGRLGDGPGGENPC